MASYQKPFPAYFILTTAAVFCFCTISPSSAELPRLNHPTKDGNQLSFLVIGDWGRRGLYNQSQVAHQMGKVGENLNVEFVISTGDNFYDDGLSGSDDKAFFHSFVDIYTAPSLQKPWYTVLGNHDYRGDVEAQLSPLLRQFDHRWNCFRSFIVDTGTELAEIMFVDTTPFVDKYFTNSEEEETYDWSGILPRQSYLSNLLKDVDSALKSSIAKWKIVVGHHTIMSCGHHGVTDELQKHLLPILKENGVDMYINGHDHCLEHIIDSESGIHFLTSGGGSKAWRGDIRRWKSDEVKLYYDGQGFMSLQITQTEADIIYYDVAGRILHKWTISKSLHVAA